MVKTPNIIKLSGVKSDIQTVCQNIDTRPKMAFMSGVAKKIKSLNPAYAYGIGGGVLGAGGEAVKGLTSKDEAVNPKKMLASGALWGAVGAGLGAGRNFIKRVGIEKQKRLRKEKIKSVLESIGLGSMAALAGLAKAMNSSKAYRTYRNAGRTSDTWDDFFRQFSKRKKRFYSSARSAARNVNHKNILKSWGVDSSAIKTKAEFKRLFRNKIKAIHPDKTGYEEAAKVLNAQRDELMKTTWYSKLAHYGRINMKVMPNMVKLSESKSSTQTTRSSTKTPSVAKSNKIYKSPLHFIRRGDKRFPKASKTLGDPAINHVIVDTVDTPTKKTITHRGLRGFKGMKKVVTEIAKNKLFNKKNTWSIFTKGHPREFKRSFNIEVKNRGLVK